MVPGYQMSRRSRPPRIQPRGNSVQSMAETLKFTHLDRTIIIVENSKTLGFYLQSRDDTKCVLTSSCELQQKVTHNCGIAAVSLIDKQHADFMRYVEAFIVFYWRNRLIIASDKVNGLTHQAVAHWTEGPRVYNVNSGNLIVLLWRDLTQDAAELRTFAETWKRNAINF